jgi:hypothetical protein
MDWFPDCRDDWFKLWRCEQQRAARGGEEATAGKASCSEFRSRAAMCLAKDGSPQKYGELRQCLTTAASPADCKDTLRDFVATGEKRLKAYSFPADVVFAQQLEDTEEWGRRCADLLPALHRCGSNIPAISDERERAGCFRVWNELFTCSAMVACDTDFNHSVMRCYKGLDEEMPENFTKCIRTVNAFPKCRNTLLKENLLPKEADESYEAVMEAWKVQHFADQEAGAGAEYGGGDEKDFNKNY